MATNESLLRSNAARGTCVGLASVVFGVAQLTSITVFRVVYLLDILLFSCFTNLASLFQPCLNIIFMFQASSHSLNIASLSHQPRFLVSPTLLPYLTNIASLSHQPCFLVSPTLLPYLTNLVFLSRQPCLLVSPPSLPCLTNIASLSHQPCFLVSPPSLPCLTTLASLSHHPRFLVSPTLFLCPKSLNIFHTIIPISK